MLIKGFCSWNTEGGRKLTAFLTDRRKITRRFLKTIIWGQRLGGGRRETNGGKWWHVPGWHHHANTMIYYMQVCKEGIGMMTSSHAWSFWHPLNFYKCCWCFDKRSHLLCFRLLTCFWDLNYAGVLKCCFKRSYCSVHILVFFFKKTQQIQKNNCVVNNQWER